MRKKVFFTFLFVFLMGYLSSVLAQVSEEEALYQKAEGFISLIVQKDFIGATEKFNQKVSEALPAYQLEAIWNQLIASFGDFQSMSRKKFLVKDEFKVVILTLEFEKAFMDARITFDQEEKIAGFWINPPVSKAEYTPPSYVDKNSFTENEVQIGEDPWKLPGILSIPKEQKKSVGVILVHGSGPNDMDETIGPNKVFRDLAWGLSSNGIAVLRYDKRTKVYGEKLDPKKITVDDEVIEDALKAIDYLRNDKRIDSEKIYLLGHSLGGMLAPEIGFKDGALKGVIIMAGSTRPLEDLVVEQTEYIAGLDGELDSVEQKQLERFREDAERIKDGSFGDDEMFLSASGRYWKDLKKRDQIEFAQKLLCPILILQGGRDYQVTQEDFDGWKKGLKEKKNVTFKLYPDLNHLFMSGEGKSTPSEYEKEGHIERKVIEDITKWIKQ